MVKLRLTRTGRKNHAAYRVVAIDSRRARDSKAIEYLGNHDPHTKEVKLDKERIEYWLSVGAQPSKKVVSLLVSEGIMNKKDVETKEYNNEPGEKAKERAEKKAEKAAEKKAAKKAAKEEKAESKETEESAEEAA